MPSRDAGHEAISIGTRKTGGLKPRLSSTPRRGLRGGRYQIAASRRGGRGGGGGGGGGGGRGGGGGAGLSAAPRPAETEPDAPPLAGLPTGFGDGGVAMGVEASQWRRCSSCKAPIRFGAVYWVCNVSTCNQKRTGLVFWTVSCWE